MLNEKQEEIMEAIWCAGENKHHSINAIKKKCIVDFTEDDLAELDLINRALVARIESLELKEFDLSRIKELESEGK